MRRFEMSWLLTCSQAWLCHWRMTAGFAWVKRGIASSTHGYLARRSRCASIATRQLAHAVYRPTAGGSSAAKDASPPLARLIERDCPPSDATPNQPFFRSCVVLRTRLVREAGKKCGGGVLS